MKNPLAYLFWLIVLGGVVNYYISQPSVTNNAQSEMKEALTVYQKGEHAKTIGERKEYFNESLKLYTKMEKEYQPVYGNGKLYFDIANNYFQVGEYPMASLYYHRALKLMPRDTKTQSYLNLTNEKLGIDENEKHSSFDKIFFFYTFLSLPERLQSFFAFAALTLLFTFTYVWQRLRWMKTVALIASIPSTILLITLAYSYYLSPIEAIVVRSANLYRDAGFQYAKVLDQPVLSGKKVEVLDVLQEGKWLKVMTPDGNLGYVSDESVRII